MIESSTRTSTEAKPPAGLFQAQVVQSFPVGASFHQLRISCAPIARGARAGQFVHILPHLESSSEQISGYDPLLRRAFSIMNVGSEPHEIQGPNWLEILFRVGGKGTFLLARSRAGDVVDVLGPLGNGFPLEQAMRHSILARPLLLVGGGIGVPPLVFAARCVLQATTSAFVGASASKPTKPGALNVSRETFKETSPLLSSAAVLEAFIGARSAGEVVGVEELEKAGARVHIATDDGSRGEKGLVTEPLRQRLREIEREREKAQVASAQIGPMVWACGPWPMLKAVARVCAEAEVECWVSLEENMPCGVGVCNGCVVPVKNATDDYGRFQRICIHGPVLDAQTVEWGDPTVPPQGPSLAAQTQDEPNSSEQAGASQ